MADREKLIASITPEDASDKTLVWSSSDESIATADNDGTVSALKAGTAIISVATINDLTDTCEVNVIQLPRSITIDPTTISLGINDTQQLTATVLPLDTTDKTVTWISSDPEIATVDEDGLVTAIGAGECTITASTHNGFTATCDVGVNAILDFDYSDGLKNTTIPTPYNVNDDGIMSISTAMTYDQASKIIPAFTTNKESFEINFKVSNVDNENAILYVVGSKRVQGSIYYSGIGYIPRYNNTTTRKSRIMFFPVSGGSASYTISCEDIIDLETHEFDVKIQYCIVDNGIYSRVRYNINNLGWREGRFDNGQSFEFTSIGTYKPTGEYYGTSNYNLEYIHISKIEPYEIKFSKSTQSINKDKTYQITAIVNPADYQDEILAWNSSNESIATVDGNGLVTGVGYGSATITATLNGLSATCVITVEDLPEFDYKDAIENTEVYYSDIIGNDGIIHVPATLTYENTVFLSKPIIIENESFQITFEVANVGDINKQVWVLGTPNRSSNFETPIYSRLAIRPRNNSGYALVTLDNISNTHNEMTYMIPILQTEEVFRCILQYDVSGNKIRLNINNKGWRQYDIASGMKHTYLFSNICAFDNNGNLQQSNTYDINYLYIDPLINATSVTLDKEEILFTSIGDTETILATVLPVDTSAKDVIWSSSNGNIARVDVNGVVTSVQSGTCTITATTHNGLTATCSVEVIIEPTSIALNKTTEIVNKGQTEQLTATVLPENATDKTATWTSSNDAIATVSSTGLVTGISTGTCTITATTSNNLTAICSIEVVQLPTSITLNNTTLELIQENTEQLTATLTPDDISVGRDIITWTSLDDEIATVSSTGLVTAIEVGEVTISATTVNNLTATCDVEVIEITPFDFINEFNDAKILRQPNVDGDGIMHIVKDSPLSENTVFDKPISIVNESFEIEFEAFNTVGDTSDSCWPIGNITSINGTHSALWVKFNTNGATGLELKSTNGNAVWITYQTPAIVADVYRIKIQYIHPTKKIRMNVNDLGWKESTTNNGVISSFAFEAFGRYDNSIGVNGSKNVDLRYLHIKRVPIDVASITLDKTFIDFTELNDTEQLSATILPANADDTTVVWTSSDETVATVDDDGLVTSIDYGECTITATTHNGLSATCFVEIFEPREFDFVDEFTNRALELTPNIDAKGDLLVTPTTSGSSYATMTSRLDDEVIIPWDETWKISLEFSINDDITGTSLAMPIFNGNNARTDLFTGLFLTAIISESNYSLSAYLQMQFTEEYSASTNVKLYDHNTSDSEPLNKGQIYNLTLEYRDINRNIIWFKIGDYPEVQMQITREGFRNYEFKPIYWLGLTTSSSAYYNNNAYYKLHKLHITRETYDPIDRFNYKDDIFNTYITNPESVYVDENNDLVCMPENNSKENVLKITVPSSMSNRITFNKTFSWDIKFGVTFDRIPDTSVMIPIFGAQLNSTGLYLNMHSTKIINQIYMSSGGSWLFYDQIFSHAIILGERINFEIRYDKDRDRLKTYINNELVSDLENPSFSSYGHLNLVGAVYNSSLQPVPAANTEYRIHNLYIENLPTIEPESISLDKTTIDFTELEDIEQLVATILPEDATNQTISWSSSDDTIATVDEDGLVTSVDYGECTITATTHNNLIATCSVEVVKLPASIMLNKTSIELTPEETDQLMAIVLPTDATDKTVTWTSSDDEIATVSSIGLVTGVGVGTCTITAATSNNLTSTCDVSVIPSVTFDYRDDIKDSEINSTTLYKITEEGYIYTDDSSTLENAVQLESPLVFDRTDGFQIEAEFKYRDISLIGEDTENNTYDIITLLGADGSDDESISYIDINLTGTYAFSLGIQLGGRGRHVSIRKPSDGFDIEDTHRIIIQIIPEGTDVVFRAKLDDGVWERAVVGEWAEYTESYRIQYVGSASLYLTTDTHSKNSELHYLYITEITTEAESISLDKTTIDFTELEDTEQLVATILPADATDQTILWTSSDDDVATVDEDGLVTSIDYGECVITATTHNGLTATCDVEVEEPRTFYIDEIFESELTTSNNIDDEGVFFIDEYSTDNLVPYTNSDLNMLNKYITLKGTQKWRLEIDLHNHKTSSDKYMAQSFPMGCGSGETSSYIKCNQPTSIETNNSSIEYKYGSYSFTVFNALDKYTPDERHTIVLQCNGDNTMSSWCDDGEKQTKTINYNSSNSQKIIYYGRTLGGYFLGSPPPAHTAPTSYYGIKILPWEGITIPESIELNKTSIDLYYLDITDQLTATILPNTAVDTITWSSSNEAIATVDGNGLVTSVDYGECVITATTTNSLTATCNVSIQEPSDFDYIDEINNTYLAHVPTQLDSGDIEIIQNNYLVANKAYLNEEATLPLNEPWIIELEYTITNIASKRMILLDRKTGDYGEFCVISDYDLGSSDIPSGRVEVLRFQVSGFTQGSECVYILPSKDTTYQAGRHTIKYIYNGDGIMYTVFDNTTYNKAIILNRERLSRELKYYYVGSTSAKQSYTYSTNGLLHKLHILNPNNEIALGKNHIDTLIGREERVDFEVLGGTGIVNWQSSNPSIATVDSNGVTTGISLGDCTITGTLGEQTVTITLTVVETSIADYVDEVNNTFILQGASVNQTTGVIQGVSTPNNTHTNITYLNEPCLLSTAPEAEWEIEILLANASRESGCVVTSGYYPNYPSGIYVSNSIKIDGNTTRYRYVLTNAGFTNSLLPTEVATEPVIFRKLLGSTDILQICNSYPDQTISLTVNYDDLINQHINIYTLCTGPLRFTGNMIKANYVASIRSLHIRRIERDENDNIIERT